MRHINGCIRRSGHKPMRSCCHFPGLATAREGDGVLRKLDMTSGKPLISAGWSVRTGKPFGASAAVTNAHHVRVF